jgi:membrane protease YdiL (CAAX protease family)
MAKTTKSYLLVFSIIYITALVAGVTIYHLQLNDLLTVFLFVGVAFSFIAWLLTRNTRPVLNNDKPGQKNEDIVLTILVAWIVLYITYGGDFINGLFPKNIQDNTQWQFFIIIARKLLVFVLVPYFVYRAMGFSLQDFGLNFSLLQTFTKRNVLLLIIMSAVILLFEYFFSGGAKPLREGQFSVSQLIIAIPITFLWLFIEAGLIEEFFFRAVLQSRLAVMIKSEWGAILMGGLIFGLAHVPGLYLRGAGSEGINEQLPVWFWLSYCVANMSVAGIFPGIIWSKTKSLYLVIILHAMVDLLPNVSDFIHTWKI